MIVLIAVQPKNQSTRTNAPCHDGLDAGVHCCETCTVSCQAHDHWTVTGNRSAPDPIAEVQRCDHCPHSIPKKGSPHMFILKLNGHDIFSTMETPCYCDLSNRRCNPTLEKLHFGALSFRKIRAHCCRAMLMRASPKKQVCSRRVTFQQGQSYEMRNDTDRSSSGRGCLNNIPPRQKARHLPEFFSSGSAWKTRWQPRKTSQRVRSVVQLNI